jgi:hypothetical protein
MRDERPRVSVEEVCDLLRRNDTETTKISTGRDVQANRLIGQALRGNTRVLKSLRSI